MKFQQPVYSLRLRIVCRSDHLLYEKHFHASHERWILSDNQISWRALMFSVCQFLCDHLKSHMPSRGNMVIKTWLLIINWIMAYWSIPFFYLNTMSGTTKGTVESTDCKAEFSSRFAGKSRLTLPHRALPDTYIWLKILKIITGVRVQQALKIMAADFPFP